MGSEKGHKKLKMIKIIIKRLLFLIGFIITLPLILITRVEGLITADKGERIYSFCKELLACIPTFMGQYIRIAFYKCVCKHIDFDVSMLLGSMIAHRETVVRKNSVIGAYSIIGYADIGKNAIIGARVSVISGKYQHGRPGERSEGQNIVEEYSTIKIGNNSWIGEGAVIMAKVGDNCTIAAGSVLMKDAPDDSTFMGNPARKVNLQ